MKLQEEEIPSFAMHFSFQSNMAFMIAIFIMGCALAWALRDHRRRLLELATEEQEDRLYLTVLGILFVVCVLGSYYAFNRTSAKMAQGPSISSNVLVDELYKTFLDARARWNAAYYTQSYVPYAPDLPVGMPIPRPQLLEEAAKRKDDPSAHYHALTWFLFVLLIVFAIWYFYPRKRPDIAPPRSYGDAGTGTAEKPAVAATTGGPPTSTVGSKSGRSAKPSKKSSKK